jgi:hypothetical protein
MQTESINKKMIKLCICIEFARENNKDLVSDYKLLTRI